MRNAKCHAEVDMQSKNDKKKFLLLTEYAVLL